MQCARSERCDAIEARIAPRGHLARLAKLMMMMMIMSCAISRNVRFLSEGCWINSFTREYYSDYI